MFAEGFIRKVSSEWYAIILDGRITEIVRINYRKQKTLPIAEVDYVYIHKVDGDNYVELLGYNSPYGYKTWRRRG